MTLAQAFPYVVPAVALAAIVFAVVRAAGWRALAARFPYAGPPPPGTATFENGSACGVSFRGLLSVGADARGLYVAPSLPPLRAVFPAIGVPWNAVFPDGEHRRVFEMVRYRLGSATGPALLLFKAGRPQRVVEPWVAANGTRS